MESAYSEELNYTIPYPPPPAVDSDNDGISNNDEINLYGTDPDKADTDGDGLNDGDELDYWKDNWNLDYDGDGSLNLLDVDSDNDSVTDGSEVSNGYDPSDMSSRPISDSLVFEVGEIELNHNWQRDAFNQSFIDPVVVAKPISLNSGQSAVIRLRNVEPGGFEIKIQEWDYLDGTHNYETVSYLVIEKGNFTLDDGSQIEAGRFETDKIGSFGQFNFSESFKDAPVVLAAVTSYNEAAAVIGRLRRISNQGFEFCMQEQELNSKEHVTETIGYIAWQPSSGRLNGYTFEVGQTADKVKNKNYRIQFKQAFGYAPHFLADMQSADGMDPSNIRWQNKDQQSIEVRIAEEQSKDSETSHTTEVVGYMIFGY
jgi:hypothetical protein